MGPGRSRRGLGTGERGNGGLKVIYYVILFTKCNNYFHYNYTQVQCTL